MKTIDYKGKKIAIEQDQDAQSPQEYGDAGLFIVANHRDFYVPEPGEKRCPQDPSELLERYRKTHWIFPLEAYIHSGVRLALSNTEDFPDRQWDVSQVGFVFAAKSEWRLSKKAREAALSLIETWNQYLSGDVWCYSVGNDSCCGFYGYEYCLSEAKASADCQIEQERKEKLSRVKAFVVHRVPLEARQTQLHA